MSAGTVPPHEESGGEISMLIRALHETDQRLDDLTAGQIDTVTSRDGRSFLLSRAQASCLQANDAQQSAILDSLPAHIALLDSEGLVTCTNAAWRRFADEHELSGSDYWVGRNYLTVCDTVVGEAAAVAREVAAGIRSVLSADVPTFSLEYACPLANNDVAWYLLTVTPVVKGGPRGAVVMHMDITARKRDEDDVRRFAAAMDASPDGIFLIDRARMAFVHANEAGCRLHGLSHAQLLALPPWSVLGDSRQNLEITYDAIIGGTGSSPPEEFFWDRKHASPIWIEVRRHARRIGGRWTLVVLVRDVTLRRQADLRIAYLNRVHALLSGVNTLIVRTRDRTELFSEACRIAVEQGELAMAWIGMLDPTSGKVVSVGRAGIPDEFAAEIDRRLDRHSVSSPGESLVYRAILANTTFISNESQRDPRVSFTELHGLFGVQSIAVLPLIVADQTVGVFCLHAREGGFFHEAEVRLLTELAGDVAFAVEQIDKQERLDFLSYYDVLTGLANRNLFMERVRTHLRGAINSGLKLALFCVDIERFKNINDSLGRTAGDTLLRLVAERLSSEAGDASLVARMDADRFAVVLPVISDEEDAARFVEKSVAAFMNHPFVLGESTYRLACKMGIALFPDDGDDADTLFKNAEAALKKAKFSGDRYLFYAQKMTETVLGRLNLENQLRTALELDQFVLHYQPKFDAVSGELVGAEALIRWDDPRTGLVPPARFIPILEETGLIREVGRWALRKAVEDYGRWREAGLPVVRVAVNLSPLQLRSKDFVSEVTKIVARHEGAGDGLELEITESLIMEDVRLSIATLEAIRAMGIRIAIDDFGTGFSSLSYLSKLPIDTLKIDRSFVVDMADRPEGMSLVSIIINLAHSLNLTVVAEGVETEEQLRLLRLLSCNQIQGFLMSKPLAGKIFEQRYLVPRLITPALVHRAAG
jgi:diguanylate cyclase (GGDEF)-like protein/PAS domain S-box-containing protein